jgi:DNA-binding NarL/FixJ family response regulator
MRNGRAQFPRGPLKVGGKKSTAQMKAPQTKSKHKTQTKIKLIPAKNALGSLGLTARETEVLTWIAQGKTNYEIGVILSACTGTICKHVEHILCKLDVRNRTAAAVIALAALAKTKNMRRVVR